MSRFKLFKSSELDNRNFGLDLFRTLAILLVLISHTLLTFYKDPAYTPATVYTAVYGVELFFVLSGFLIGTILIKINNSEQKTTFRDVKGFWVRRWFRTLPNYYLMLVVYILFFKLYSLQIPYHKLPLFIVFLQTTFSHNQWFYGVAWSLSVEEWFYLSFPLVLLLVQVVFNQTKAKNVLLTIGFFLLACLFLRIITSVYLHHEWDDGIRKQMPMRLDNIAIGVLAAMMKFYREDWWIKCKNRLFLSGLSCMGLLSVVMYYGVVNGGGLYGTFFMDTFFFTGIGLSFAMLIPFTYYLKFTGFKAFRQAVTSISLISYSVYLTHPIFCYLLPVYVPGKSYTALSVVLMWAFTFITSYLVYHLYEKKITRLRDRMAIAGTSAEVGLIPANTGS